MRNNTWERLFILAFIYCCIFVLVGCSNQVAGTYISEKNDQDYTELKADGTFFVKEGRVSIYGKYEIEGNVLTLKLEGGRAPRGTIEKNYLIDDEGVKWIKK